MEKKSLEAYFSQGCISALFEIMRAHLTEGNTGVAHVSPHHSLRFPRLSLRLGSVVEKGRGFRPPANRFPKPTRIPSAVVEGRAPGWEPEDELRLYMGSDTYRSQSSLDIRNVRTSAGSSGSTPALSNSVTNRSIEISSMTPYTPFPLLK